MTQAFTFPAILLPAYIGAALLLAFVLRKHGPESSWRFRDIVLVAGPVLAILCAALAVLLMPRLSALQAGPQAGAASFEADMLVSRGDRVELWFNDWQHPSEHLPVVAGERHTYRFTQIPRDIRLVRFDPTDLPDARIVIYSLRVKIGDQIQRQFGPADLKTWTLHDVGPPQEEDGGLVLVDTTNDPILWTPVSIQLPDTKPSAPPSLVELYYRPALCAIAGLLLALVTFMAVRKSPLLEREFPPRYREMLLGPWGMLAIALMVAGVVVTLQGQAADTDIGLEADMLITRGNTVELWFNDWQHPSEQLRVVAGERHIYRFDKIPREIHLLRLDPTDQPDTRIVLYGITIKNRSQVFQKFGPAEFRTWTLHNLSAPKDEDGGLAFTSVTDDPIFTVPLQLQLPGGSLRMITKLLGDPASPVLSVIPAFLMLLLVRMSTRSGRWQAVMIALAACVAYPVVVLVIKLNLLLPPPVSSSVGYAAYVGYAKSNEHFATGIVMLICAGLGYLFARLAGPPGVNDVDADIAAPVAVASPRHIWIAHAAVFLLLFLYFFPDLLGTLRSLSGVVYRQGGWDDANALVWSFMVHTGQLPLRDFWYPYSGSYIHLLPFPTGLITAILHATLLLWVLYLAWFRITGRRLVPALVLFGVVLAPVLMDLTPGVNRYLLAVEVVLLYAGICDEPRLEWKTHLPFAAFAGYVFFYEPTQIIYSSAGIAAHTVLSALGCSIWSTRFRLPRERLMAGVQLLKQRLLCIAMPMCVGIAGALLFFGVNGMLPGLWDLEASIGDIGDYGDSPADVTHWVQPILQPDTVFLMMFLLASYAVYRWIRRRGQENDPLGTALIALGASTLLVMQKQVSRPHVMLQLRIFPFVATLVFGLIVWRERKPSTRILIVAFLGCLLGIAAHRDLLRGIVAQDLEVAPGKISDSLDALLHHRDEIDRLNATLYARSRFVGFDLEYQLVDNLNQVCGRRPQDTVYVLGDSPIFYILLNQPAAYDSNSYNTSPLREQQKMLEWLQRKRPRFVIWPTKDLVYDFVPHMVRLPLIYNYVVEHYRFVRAIGPYHILEELPPGTPPDLDYFRSVLTARVDLGSIPGRSRPSEYAACAGDVARCDAVLVVKYGSAPSQRKLVVDIDSFQVQLDLNPKEREYIVNLNRLWFWEPLAKTPPPRITAEDAAASATLEYRRERTPVLY